MKHKDATHILNGVFYKSGAHGFIYYWSVQHKEWMRDGRLQSLAGMIRLSA